MPASLEKEVLMHVTAKVSTEDLMLSDTCPIGVGGGDRHSKTPLPLCTKL